MAGPETLEAIRAGGGAHADGLRQLIDLLLAGGLPAGERARAQTLLLDLLSGEDAGAAHPLVARAQARLAAAGERAREAEGTAAWRWSSDAAGRLTGDGGGWLAPSLAALAAGNGALAEALGDHQPFRGIVVGGVTFSGVPRFAQPSGRFDGYAGTASAAVEVSAAPGPDCPAADARFAHEVRSPLNAIVGFAELIAGEVSGPAPEAMRAGAERIVAASNRVLAALDDLTDAARLDLGRYPLDAGWIEAGARIAAIRARHLPLAAERGVTLGASVEAAIWMQIDSDAFDRLLDRLLSAALAAAEPGETLQLSAGLGRGDSVVIELSRPRRLAGLAAEAFQAADPGDGAPLVGLGFAFRLVGQLAARLGGVFDHSGSCFRLTLPALASDARVATPLAIS